MRRIILAFLLGATSALAVDPPQPSPYAIDIPRWFTESFLDLREDIRDAARGGKRVMLYFGQDGCPYCKALMKADFGDPAIAAQTQRHFVAIALNIWGDREVTWVDGRKMPEKNLASILGVQFTPTLLFLDERGGVALRLNGYLPPQKFRVALDYASGRLEKRETFTRYVERRASASTAGIVREPFLVERPGKPRLLLFERGGCTECEEMHREAFARREIRDALANFSIVQVDAAKDSAAATAHRIVYAPTLVFLDTEGKEVFRVEGYVRPFHVAGALDYVATGAYRREASFQRYLRERADARRARGEVVDLWK